MRTCMRSARSRIECFVFVGAGGVDCARGRCGCRKKPLPVLRVLSASREASALRAADSRRHQGTALGMNSAGIQQTAQPVVAIRSGRGYSSTNCDGTVAYSGKPLRREFGQIYDGNSARNRYQHQGRNTGRVQSGTTCSTTPSPIVLISQSENRLPAFSRDLINCGRRNATGTLAVAPGERGPASLRIRRQSNCSPSNSNGHPSMPVGVGPLRPPASARCLRERHSRATQHRLGRDADNMKRRLPILVGWSGLDTNVSA